jgi:hypothetical protein
LLPRLITEVGRQLAAAADQRARSRSSSAIVRARFAAATLCGGDREYTFEDARVVPIRRALPDLHALLA